MQMEGSMPIPNDKQFYLDATQEVDSGTQDPALWAKAASFSSQARMECACRMGVLYPRWSKTGKKTVRVYESVGRCMARTVGMQGMVVILVIGVDVPMTHDVVEKRLI